MIAGILLDYTSDVSFGPCELLPTLIAFKVLYLSLSASISCLLDLLSPTPSFPLLPNNLLSSYPPPLVSTANPLKQALLPPLSSHPPLHPNFYQTAILPRPHPALHTLRTVETRYPRPLWIAELSVPKPLAKRGVGV